MARRWRDLPAATCAARGARRAHRAARGGLALAAYAVRAGAIVNFFSETVLVGFKCGVALFLASTQLPKLFGFSGGHGGISGSAWATSSAASARPTRRR